MTIYEIIARVLDAFGCMVVLAFWIGFWFWFLTRKDSQLKGSSPPRKRSSPPLDTQGEGFSSDAM